MILNDRMLSINNHMWNSQNSSMQGNDYLAKRYDILAEYEKFMLINNLCNDNKYEAYNFKSGISLSKPCSTIVATLSLISIPLIVIVECIIKFI